MKLLLALSLPIVALVAPAVAAVAAFQDAQDPADGPPPLPPDAAARIDDEIITFAEYQAFLLRLYGAGPLQDLILTKLFEREAMKLGIQLEEDELDREIERFWEQYLRRFRGDPNAAERELSAAGFTAETYRAKMREELRRDLLEDRILRASREVTDEALFQRFEQVHGAGGVRVDVRHILFTPARIKADLRVRGAAPHEIDDARVDAELEAAATRALARLRAGEDFAAVARAESHDVSVHQNGGTIPGYNYDRYGEAFAAAVHTAEVGAVFGPIESPVGRHLVEVTDRTTTALADVRDELTAALLAAPPTWQERNDLRLRLRSEARIQTYR